MISIQDLDFCYGPTGFRLQIPELEIPQGQTVAIIGPSGSGKTTLLNLLAGISHPENGSISIDSVKVHQLNEAARRDFRIKTIGFVFQNFELVEYLNVLENILLPYFINPTLKLTRQVRAVAVELAASFGLQELLGRRIRQLSQGEMQRVAVARALLPSPRLLLADEPTGNLDPANKQTIIKILKEQAARTGATLLVVTHDHSLLSGFDRVLPFDEFRREA